ncbi:MAG: hypothetical protein KJS91_18035 [Planctomycetes bacterium]|nr:hypothetical protein [Planctomycetota bacterium]
MTPINPAETWITIQAAAAMLGVTRQRVLRATSEDPHEAKMDEPLPVRDTAPEGAPRRQLLVQLAAVIAWRTRRVLAHQPVGPLPDAYADLRDYPPPVPEVPEMPPFVGGIGLPNVRPF